MLKNNSKQMTKSPVLSAMKNGDDEAGVGNKNKKKMKKKNKKVSGEVNGKRESSSGNSQNGRSSNSSLEDEAISSDGSILRSGIKFASFEEFCSFVDAKEPTGQKRKPSPEKVTGKQEEIPPPKKKKMMDKSAEESPKSDDAKSPSEKKTKLQEQPQEHSFDVDKLKAILDSPEQVEEAPSKAKNQLKSSRFRYLNELLYTQPGSQSFKMFRSDLDAFKTYHEGYMEQLKKWPKDPLQSIIDDVMKRTDKDSIVVADFGCGEARLARAVPDMKVHSFDFVALNDLVTSCDMSKTPLEDETVDIAVFCLSLMGTNLNDYLREANRVLKNGGVMKIAEVESRFQEITVDSFIGIVQKFGFNLKWKDVGKGFFVFMDFTKESPAKKKTPEVSLKPCFYKKR